MDRVVRDFAAMAEQYDTRDFMLFNAQINLHADAFAKALIAANSATTSAAISSFSAMRRTSSAERGAQRPYIQFSTARGSAQMSRLNRVMACRLSP